MTMTMRKLGKKGRFSNQLLQYAKLRQMAATEHERYSCPSWIGQYLFGLNDPLLNSADRDISLKIPLQSSSYDKDAFRAMFQPVWEVRHQIDDMNMMLPMSRLQHLRVTGYTLIGLHLRRGDYGTFRRKSARWAFVAETQWYIDWLEKNLHRFNNPLLVIASDEIKKVRDVFGAYLQFEEAGKLPKAPDYPDFYTLTQCDVMLISNSTFGFAASMLNTRATEFWRPRLSEKALIPYDPWDAPVVFKDELYD